MHNTRLTKFVTCFFRGLARGALRFNPTSDASDDG